MSVLGEHDPRAIARELLNKEMQAELDKDAAKARKKYEADRDERIALNLSLRPAPPAPTPAPVAANIRTESQPKPLTPVSKAQLSRVFLAFHRCPNDANGYTKFGIVTDWARLRGYPCDAGYGGSTPSDTTIRRCVEELRSPDFAMVFDPSGEVSRKMSASSAVSNSRTERQQ